ncbi:hypothetical protein EDI_278520 [Entamoeba dispar SAW760]|uniref:Uncharacterized protein n=1 Tax=Entamoeba dispar (strain ATCC PRA-260 / SAW760) TaxID=370354 RepID=B0ECY9_ENTDS|nr:uncharacterized protein EDI_278520 [Entamoeba dispar SAW760]EDR27681.1 hypothetical protein EDI_278520 [Entamoeba dispar SAW760]|eukprot:EDR27681.1 hypothetical protein EDI_278520 [Entamoeba dispar SAW760]
MKRIKSNPLIIQLNNFNQHFEKLLALGIVASSPAYPQLVMANVDKIKELLEKFQIGIININDRKTFDTLFEFWAHLLYICNYGYMNSSMVSIFNILYQCISLTSFSDMAKQLLTKEITQDLLDIYQSYIVSCRETYLLISQLLEKTIKGIIGEEIFDKLTLQSLDDLYLQLSTKINLRMPEGIDIVISKIIGALCVIDKEILNNINKITQSENNESTTIAHYNYHFLLDFIPTTNVLRQGELQSIIPIILIYPNPFMFIVWFIPQWIKSLKRIGIIKERIIRSNEFFMYKRWFFELLGKMMRKFQKIKENKALCTCFKSIIKENDITDVNELLFIIKTNTNIYDTKQMIRMGKMIENILRYYIKINNGLINLFDDTFNIHDFIQIIEMSILADHLESLLKLLGLIYDILPYFIKTSRDILLLDYLINKRFSYFFFHWSDLIRTAFFHIILYRSLFIKSNHLLSSKLTQYEINQYKKRKTELYDPKEQDINIYTSLKERIDMLNSIINSLPSEKHLNELKMIKVMNEFTQERKEYFNWLNKKNSNDSDIPKIISTIDISSE